MTELLHPAQTGPARTRPAQLSPAQAVPPRPATSRTFEVVDRVVPLTGAVGDCQALEVPATAADHEGTLFADALSASDIEGSSTDIYGSWRTGHTS